MIIKEIANRVRRAKIEREKTLHRKNAGLLVLGVTLGTAVGALAGVLFAPRAGKKTREDLVRQGSDAWEKIQENASHTGHRLASAVEETSSRVRAKALKRVDAAKGASKESSPMEEEENSKKH